MLDEPIAGDPSDLLQRSRLLEQVGGAGDDIETRFAAKPPQRPSIEFEHFVIIAADDQKRRRLDVRQRLGGEIGASATRHDCGDSRGLMRGGDQGRRCSRARAEEPDRKIADLGQARRPGDGLLKARRKETDIEDVSAMLRFFRAQ